MKISRLIDELIGWGGALAIIGAFALVSFRILAPTALLYQLLNFWGALAVSCLSFKKKAYQPGILNLVWAVIAGLALFKILK